MSCYFSFNNSVNSVWFLRHLIFLDILPIEKYSLFNLKAKRVRKMIYLFSCNGGAGKKGKNVAKFLSEITGCIVNACTGHVSFSEFYGKYYARKSKDLGFEERCFEKKDYNCYFHIWWYSYWSIYVFKVQID